MKNVLIVDDHGIVRIGVRLLLKEIDSSLNVLVAATKDEAQAFIKEIREFDLFVLDINIPNYSCERMIEFCKIHCPNAKIFILSTNSEKIMAKKFYKLGVDAFVNKAAGDENLKQVFKNLFQNKKYYSPDFLEQLADEALDNRKSDENPFNALSSRELEVVQFLVEGKTIQDISSILAIHSSTIGTYKSRIFEKLKIKNLIELYNMFEQYNQ